MAAGHGKLDTDLYRLLVEQVKDYALFLLDPRGHVMSWNEGAQRIKGYTADEIIGKHFSIFYSHRAVEDGWPAHELRVAAAEGRFEDEGWRLRKDGSRFWANVVITALRDDQGGLVAFSKITRDLTARKAQEEALRESEERFRLLVEGVDTYAIFMLDQDGVVTSWNDGAERIYGYYREDIIGAHCSRLYPPEDTDAGKPAQMLATARQTGRYEAEGWRIRASGERFWSRVVVTTVHASDGHLRGFAKVTQDLTERRHAENLERTAANVNEFIATLAHELRNPLAAISNALHVIDGVAPDDPLRAAMLRTIARQSTQLARIVDDTLDASRIIRGVIHIERRPADLADVVHGAIETARPNIEAGRHTVQVKLPAQAVVVDGDSARLKQLLTNLLNNAAIYSPSAGKIEVAVQAEGGRAVVRVRDNGSGIAPHMLERIFDMFVQGRQPAPGASGLGVGLAFARKIAELHGGLLEARSEGEGKGSEFELRLPLATSTVAVAAAQAHAERAVPRRILVVDDNHDAAASLALFLESLGHETCVAHDGERALNMAIRFRPDMVLLDIGMPGVDGYELARRLRALPQPVPLHIVAVTGYGRDIDRQQSREAGVDEHLVKPVSENELARVLGEAAP